jgi:hypothetical protein
VKRVAMLAFVSACYLGAHGGVDATLRSRDVATSSPQGAIDLGGGGGDDKQSVVLLLSIGRSPLVASDDSLDRPTMYSVGTRYDRAFNRSHRSLRWFGRILMGGSICGTDEDPDCMSDTARSAAMYSLAFGVALSDIAAKSSRHELTPVFGNIGVGLVYTYAADERLGTADFLGLELSLGFGGDAIMPFANAGH